MSIAYTDVGAAKAPLRTAKIPRKLQKRIRRGAVRKSAACEGGKHWRCNMAYCTCDCAYHISGR